MDRTIRFTFIVLDGIRVRPIDNRRLTPREIREYAYRLGAKYEGSVKPKDGIYQFYCFKRRSRSSALKQYRPEIGAGISQIHLQWRQ